MGRQDGLSGYFETSLRQAAAVSGFIADFFHVFFRILLVPMTPYVLQGALVGVLFFYGYLFRTLIPLFTPPVNICMWKTAVSLRPVTPGLALL